VEQQCCASGREHSTHGSVRLLQSIKIPVEQP
jgi:hypothetical protein